MIQITEADLNSATHGESIVHLLNTYALDPMGGGRALPDFVQENLVPELRRRSGVAVVLAWDEARPVGLAICFEGFSTFACRPLLNIHDIVVDPAYRGRGISRQLLTHVETIARERGCCKLTLEVLEGNTVAQQAYHAFGFAGYALNPATGHALFWQKPLD